MRISAADAPGGIATPELVAALLADGDDDLAAWAIGQALEEQPRTVVFEDVVRPAMELVGSRWSSGQWTISQEHLASVALIAALARLRPTEASDSRIGPLAVLAAPAGEQHVAGLACLAQILEERGWRVENLGADLPADDLQRFITGREVDLLALSIGTAAHLASLRATVDTVRHGEQEGRFLPILVGGRGVEGTERDIAGADLVTSSLQRADEYIAMLEQRLPVQTAPGPQLPTMPLSDLGGDRSPTDGDNRDVGNRER